MRLLTIGVFARQCRLSPKALRLYDELGLLRPVQTDPHTGYRLVRAGAARACPPGGLAAPNRHAAGADRSGVPRAIGDVAAVVTGYWRQVEAEHAARAELVSSLVQHLQRGDTDMTGSHAPLRLRWATYRDRGQVREPNQDSVWASEGLLGVADGFGPSADAALPSAVALLTLAGAGPGATSPARCWTRCTPPVNSPPRR